MIVLEDFWNPWKEYRKGGEKQNEAIPNPAKVERVNT